MAVIVGGGEVGCGGGCGVYFVKFSMGGVIVVDEGTMYGHGVAFVSVGDEAS